MKLRNEMELSFDSIPENEAFARVAVGAFFAQLDPTLEEIYDVKTAISEAVTNAIRHGYEGRVEKVKISCLLQKKEGVLEVEVCDSGCGIVDIKQAMEPLYTSKSQYERAGMGFAFMEAFMDQIEVISQPNQGTTVKMKKILKKEGEGEETWNQQSL